MGIPYASGKKAFGFCDRCGFRADLRKLKHEYVKQRVTGLLVCPSCWTKDHPQLMLGTVPVYDPQALRNPRPDTGQAASRGGTTLNYTAILAAILRVPVGLQPETGLFATTQAIQGRPLADISGNGNVGIEDWIAYNKFVQGTSSGDELTYITSVMNPYILGNPVRYSAYIT